MSLNNDMSYWMPSLYGMLTNWFITMAHCLLHWLYPESENDVDVYKYGVGSHIKTGLSTETF